MFRSTISSCSSNAASDVDSATARSRSATSSSGSGRNDGQNTRRDDLQYRANLVYYLGVRSGRTPVMVSLHVDSNANPSVVGPLRSISALMVGLRRAR